MRTNGKRKHHEANLDPHESQASFRQSEEEEQGEEKLPQNQIEDQEEEQGEEKLSQNQIEDREEEEVGQPDLDEFGFSKEDGNMYLDGTRPADFPPAHPDFDMRKEDLSTDDDSTGLKFSGRYALLRGRDKDGSLYSSPTIFLLKEFQGEHECFHIPANHCFALKYFTESLGNQMMALMAKKGWSYDY